MKKTIGLLLASFSFLSAGDASQEPKPPVFIEQVEERTELVLGKEAVQTIREKYKTGEYDAFLKEMDRSYTQAKGDLSLFDFAELRTSLAPADAEWVAQVKTLQKAKNQELLQAVQSENSVFADKVRSVAENKTPANVESAFAFLAMLHQKTPESGSSSEENALIDLDLEYEYKATRVGKDSQAREKLAALKLEQMDKMLLATQTFDDADMRAIVETLAQNIDARLSYSWDVTDLQMFARDQIKPSNANEEKVVSILKAYQDQTQSLMAK